MGVKSIGVESTGGESMGVESLGVESMAAVQPGPRIGERLLIVGLGLMGFQDALYELRIPYASNEAVEFADRSMEAICYYEDFSSLQDRAIADLKSFIAAKRERYGATPEQAQLSRRRIVEAGAVPALVGERQREGQRDRGGVRGLRVDAAATGAGPSHCRFGEERSWRGAGGSVRPSRGHPYPACHNGQ